ncbi:FxLYD domain-containing protein [Natronosalvus halobius]|uniref:FxLYD domain-containing protein n=1 Tax=Natronosalvus halobius TaxID=2953746 RepID=UPI0020A15723|nr:FxLYD domain-containing protein [Natronosalvus halobius]USZ70214.1 FxLYD domain-containing protein [Natronosalvus halobius]
MKRRALLASTAFASLSLSGCLDLLTDNGEDILQPTDLVVVWSDLLRENPWTDDERVSVWGLVRNEGEREPTYVEIRATFFDADGEELDTVIELIDDTTEGTDWPFEVEFPHFGEAAREVASYELEPATSV